MAAHDFNIILQISCITLLGLVCILLIKYARKGLNSWTGISFVVAVICYLILETPFIRNFPALYIIALTGSIIIPVLFFLLTKAIFDDHFTPSYTIVIWFALTIISHSWIYLKGIIQLDGLVLHVFYLVAEIISIGFVLAGIYTAIRTRKTDLVEARLKFRNTFIAVTAAIIGITLIVESMPTLREHVDILQIFQRISILGLTLFFLVSSFEIKSGFFFKELPKERAPVIKDSSLRNKLEMLLDEKKIYRKEGLTIKELAEIMNEQEYKIRRLINGELGYRNFNDFLNKYRINEACEILSDPTQNKKTILEIAYGLGYQSIGPFNKAFKELKETTPTAFRKAIQN